MISHAAASRCSGVSAIQFLAGYFSRIQKTLNGRRWIRGVQDTIGDAVIPIYWNHFQQWVDIGSARNCQQHIVGVFAAVEDVHAVKFKIHDIYLWMVLP